jgi:hypothetical protein
LKDLGSKSYKDQSVWFLNSFWKTFGQKEAENIWQYALKMGELDKDKGKEGCNLDEFQAHRFLEIFKETLTVLQMREKLVTVGIDKVKYVPLTYYLIFKFSADWHYLVNAPQGDNQEEVRKAQLMLESVQKAFVEVQKTAEESAIKVKEAKEAQIELGKAQQELKEQEDAYNQKTEDLKKKSQEGGVVAQNKAKNELSQHLAADPLPLSRAKISTDAAVKKAERAATAAEAAKAAAEAAVESTKVKLEEAEKYLTELMSKPGSAQGALWWIDRELHEAKKYLPERKGGMKKN